MVEMNFLWMKVEDRIHIPLKFMEESYTKYFTRQDIGYGMKDISVIALKIQSWGQGLHLQSV